MRKYFYTKFYMCSPVVYNIHGSNRGAAQKCSSLSSSSSCFTLYVSFNQLSYGDGDSNSIFNGIPASLWLSTFNCVTL